MHATIASILPPFALDRENGKDRLKEIQLTPFSEIVQVLFCPTGIADAQCGVDCSTCA
jgi:hypothetical protein